MVFSGKLFWGLFFPSFFRGYSCFFIRWKESKISSSFRVSSERFPPGRKRKKGNCPKKKKKNIFWAWSGQRKVAWTKKNQHQKNPFRRGNWARGILARIQSFFGKLKVLWGFLGTGTKKMTKVGPAFWAFFKGSVFSWQISSPTTSCFPPKRKNYFSLDFFENSAKQILLQRLTRKKNPLLNLLFRKKKHKNNNIDHHQPPCKPLKNF